LYNIMLIVHLLPKYNYSLDNRSIVCLTATKRERFYTFYVEPRLGQCCEY
jgi:hypothetical protein